MLAQLSANTAKEPTLGIADARSGLVTASWRTCSGATDHTLIFKKLSEKKRVKPLTFTGPSSQQGGRGWGGEDL